MMVMIRNNDRYTLHVKPRPDQPEVEVFRGRFEEVGMVAAAFGKAGIAWDWSPAELPNPSDTARIPALAVRILSIAELLREANGVAKARTQLYALADEIKAEGSDEL